MRRLVPVVLLLGVLVAGCTPLPPEGSATASPTLERLTEPITFDNALASDQNLEDEYWTTMQKDLGIVLSDETRTDRYGSWHPLTLAPDAPVLDIDPSVVPAGLDPMWTPEKIRSAWQLAAKYLVSEWLDSELVWDDTSTNRQLLANRIISTYLDSSIPYKVVEGFDVTPAHPGSAFGPLFVDQDYDGWRQGGGTFYKGMSYETILKPEAPAAYSPNEPRTFVKTLTLDKVSKSDDPHMVEIDASVTYYRPVLVGQNTLRYERGDLSITFTMVDGADAVHWGGEVQGASVNHYQEANVSNETRNRLPLLKPTSADERGWLSHEQGGLALRLPSSAVPDADGSCEYQPSDDRPGQVFRLGTDFGDRAGCVRITSWTPATKDKPQTEAVRTNEEIWGAGAPGLLGTVDIRTYASYETVDFYLTEGAGPDYQITADVPPGTGKQFARQLLSTLDASRSASPSPSET